MNRDNLLPLSIIAGAALIALGLFFGLRAGPRGGAPSTTAGAPAAAPVPQSAIPIAPSAAAPALQQAAQGASLDQVRQHVVRALAVEKEKTLVPKCWQPLLAKTPSPARAKYTFNLAFDAQGKEIARAISEHREAERADVGQCLRGLPGGLTIPPPGTGIPTVEVELEFP